jgi:hypothetical protein
MKTVFGGKCDQQLDRLANAKLGCCQVKFSIMFTERHIKVTDYSDFYHTPFWNRKLCVDCSIAPRIPKAVFIPLQMITNGDLELTISNLDFAKIPKHSAVLRKAHRQKMSVGSRGK